MNEFLNHNVSDKIKKILKEKLDPSCSIIEHANVRVYISYRDKEDFEYTNLEGFLCLIINRKHSCLFFQIYDYIHYKKEFELELYTNIEKGYTVLNDNFHCIEYPSFFIGINFANKINAEKMKNTIFYNSIILNFKTDLFSISNTKKSETDNQRNVNIINEMNNFSTIEEVEKANKIVSFYINREDNDVVFDVKREEFETNFNSLGLYILNLDGHYKKKIKGSISKSDDNQGINIVNNPSENKKFIEFDSSKRKSIYSGVRALEYKSTVMSGFGEDDRRQSKHYLNINKRNIGGEPRTMQDEIRQGVKLKAVPKNLGEKKPIKVTPLSSDPQLQMALRLQENNQINETLSNDEDD